MKSKNFKSKFAVLILFLLSTFNLNAQDATDVIKKLDQVMYSAKNMSAKSKITIIDNKGKEEVREATILQKGTDKRMFRFTAPASQAGIAVLSLPNDVMYLYLPAFGKERRIASSAKNQNFAGTDFSYEDMESVQYADKYSSKLIKNDTKVFVIELIPKGRSEYTKIIAHINKEHFYPEIVMYYDKVGNKVKEVNYTFVKKGNYWNASKIEMKDLKRNRITNMEMTDVQYDIDLKDDEFTVRKLVQ